MRDLCSKTRYQSHTPTLEDKLLTTGLSGKPLPVCGNHSVWLSATPGTAAHPPGSSVHGVLQARTLEWVAIPFSRGVFPTQGSKPGLQHWMQILHRLSLKTTAIMTSALSNLFSCITLIICRECPQIPFYCSSTFVFTCVSYLNSQFKMYLKNQYT